MSKDLNKVFADFTGSVENGMKPEMIPFPTSITDLIIKKRVDPKIIKNLFSINCNISRIAK